MQHQCFSPWKGLVHFSKKKWSHYILEPKREKAPLCPGGPSTAGWGEARGPVAAPGCAVSCAVSSPCDSGTGLPCRGSSLFKTEGWKFGILGSWPSLTLKTTPQAQRISHCCSTTGGGFSRKGGQMAFSGPSSEMWSVMHGVNEAWCPLNTACPGRAGVRPSPASFWASWPCALKHTHTHTHTHTQLWHTLWFTNCQDHYTHQMIHGVAHTRKLTLSVTRLSPQRWAHPHWSLSCALHGRLQMIYALGSSEPPVLCLSVPFSTLSFPSSLPWLASVSCSDAFQAVSGTGLRHLQGPLQVQGSLNELWAFLSPQDSPPIWLGTSFWLPPRVLVWGGLHRAVTR